MKFLIKIDKTLPIESYDLLYNYYSNYKRKYSSDSGCDLIIPKNYICHYNNPTPIDLGISCRAITNDGRDSGFYLMPRSSIYNTPLRLANSIGLIDSEYRGNLIAMVDNNHKYNAENIINHIIFSYFILLFFFVYLILPISLISLVLLCLLIYYLTQYFIIPMFLPNYFIKIFPKNISKQNDKKPIEIKLFQIVNPTLEPCEIQLVDNLNETDRGADGFGSTNIIK